MAFFVPEQKRGPIKPAKSKTDGNKTEIELLAIGKRVGLNFAEMNELRIRDLLDLAKCYSGAEEDGPRDATQGDIDAFFGG
ncbi:hypothetical protein J31TS4_15850 [Paenibacillus sp. J31TS4]|nr:hypothetical protein J31TS4_15850 [Paenibacillus sp. J31TS4]